MITPKEIETKAFTRAKTGGYKPDEVDSFLDEILVSYTKLLEERDTLARKVNDLSGKLDSTRDEQDQWKSTIISAQKSYNDVISSANRKADKLVFEAQDYAKKLIKAAQEEAENQKIIKENLANEVEDFKSRLLAIYENHIKLVTNIPVIKKEVEESSSKTLEILKAATADVEEVDSIINNQETIVENDSDDLLETIKEVSVKEDLDATKVIESIPDISFKEAETDEDDIPVFIPASTKKDEVKDVNSTNITSDNFDSDEADQDDEDEDDDIKVGGLFGNKKGGLFGKKKTGKLFGKKSDDDDDDDDDDDEDDEDF